MNMKYQNRGFSEQKRAVQALRKSIKAINEKSAQLYQPVDQLSSALKSMKSALPALLHMNGYFNTQKKNRRMLPVLPFRPSFTPKPAVDEKNATLVNQVLGLHIRSSRNSKVLNSLIQILKTDSDKTEVLRHRNRKIKTQASDLKQFLEAREISSVKNSRAPKIIHNKIMMTCQRKTKRLLLSGDKTREKINRELNSTIQSGSLKAEPIQEMQITFYKPPKLRIKQKSLLKMVKQEENQFITL